MVGSSGVIGLGQTALTAASNGISKGSIFFLHGTCNENDINQYQDIHINEMMHNLFIF